MIINQNTHNVMINSKIVTECFRLIKWSNAVKLRYSYGQTTMCTWNVIKNNVVKTNMCLVNFLKYMINLKHSQSQYITFGSFIIHFCKVIPTSSIAHAEFLVVRDVFVLIEASPLASSYPLLFMSYFANIVN